MDASANEPATDDAETSLEMQREETAPPEADTSGEGAVAPESSESGRQRAARPTETGEPNKGSLTFDPSIAIEIAHHEARKMDEVLELSGGFIDGWMKGRSKGIKIEEADDAYSVRLNIIVKYGTNCPELANQLRERIENEIRHMTGREVRNVHIHIAGVKAAPSGEPTDDLDHAIDEDYGINF